jgi:hypothetical protein
LSGKQETTTRLLSRDEKGQEIFDYMERITGEAGLNAGCEWGENEVVILS